MRKFFDRYGLLLVVFLTGASVLVVEIAAVRVLSPYFGNTIYTVSSIIGVILAALSLGYAFGGKFIDQNPDERWFYTIIFLSGIGVLILEMLTVIALPSWGHTFSLTVGPFISSVLLFLFPSVLLGMLSPMAIVLQRQRRATVGVGSVSGNVFFWSTLGSIVGSFAAGFIFIPHLGVHQILTMTGVGLIFLGCVPLLVRRVPWARSFALFAVAMLLVAAGVLIVFDESASAVYSRDGVYEKITIRDVQNEVNRPVRLLMQDRTFSGARYLDSSEDVFSYSEYVKLHQIFLPELRRALVLGGGAYTIPTSLIRASSRVQVDVAEIEPQLFELAQRYFDVPLDPRLVNHVVDGRRFLYDTDEPYDLIYSDVYISLYSVPAHFTTREFFELARARLVPRGLFIANIIGDLRQTKPSFLLSEMRTFQSVFPNSYFFATQGQDFEGLQNVVFVGYVQNEIIDIAHAAREFGDDDFFRQLPLQRIETDRFDLSSYPLLTDDYAPVEYMIGKAFQE